MHIAGRFFPSVFLLILPPVASCSKVTAYKWQDVYHALWQPWLSIRPNRQLPDWTNRSYGIGC